MDMRRAAPALALLLLAWSASAARGEDTRPARTASEKIQALQSDIGDPSDFKRYVEGSRRLPEAPSVPRVQPWPQSAGKAAGRAVVKAAQLSPALPIRQTERHSTLPPIPAYVDRTPMPVSDNLPQYPLKGLAIFALAAAGLFALSHKREFEAAPPAVLESVRPAPAELLIPQALSETPPALSPSIRGMLARIEFPPEQFVDTRMPVSTWRAISWPEQQLIEIWDTSYEKSLGQPFADWLDTQEGIEGVDVPLLKAKLEREA